MNQSECTALIVLIMFTVAVGIISGIKGADQGRGLGWALRVSGTITIAVPFVFMFAEIAIERLTGKGSILDAFMAGLLWSLYLSVRGIVICTLPALLLAAISFRIKKSCPRAKHPQATSEDSR